MSEFTFRIANESDKECIGKFLLEHFFNDEPICRSENATIDDISLGKILKCIDSGTCTIAEDADGNLAGLRLAMPKTPEDVKSMNVKNPKKTIDRMWRMVYDIAVAANAFERYGVDKIMQSMVLSVDGKYRGKGLGTQLYAENMKLAKDLGYKVYVCDCTSLFSAKACLKLGFETIFEIAYSDYKNDKGVQIFKPNAPHDKIRVLAKVL